MILRLSPLLRRVSGRPVPESGPGAQMLLLAALFLAGALGGYWYAVYCSGHSALLLADYLEGYCLLYGDEVQRSVPLFSALRLYYGGLIGAFFFGFTGLGVLVIPAIAALSGFTAMFAVGCFALIYGRAGVLLALAALGIRLLFTLPCLFWAGSHAWSAALALLPGRRGKRCAPVVYDGPYFYRLLVCVVLLAVGVCLERCLTPYLFHAALLGLEGV